MSEPDGPIAMVAECKAGVVDAHATVANSAIDWPDGAPMAALHELDDAEQSLREAEEAVDRAMRAVSS